MKLNWGWGIAIALATFIIIILGLIFKGAGSGIPELTSNDYYSKEMHFQEIIDKRRNAKSDHKELKLTKLDGAIKIHLNAKKPKKVTGTIHFIRPSDKTLDQQYTLVFNEDNIMLVPSDKFKKGQYKVNIDWTEKDKSYWIESDFYFE